MGVRISVLGVLALAMLPACQSSGSSGGDTGTDSDSDTDTDVDTDTDTGTALPYDCDNLPQGPFTPALVDNAIASIDMAFDDEGNLVGSDDHNIYKTPFGGDPELFLEGLDFRSKIAFLSNGDLIYADPDLGRLMRVDGEGTSHIVLSGLAYPRGVTVGEDGLVYVSETSADRVRRVDPMTSDSEIIVADLAEPADIEFSPDYTVLYIAGWGTDGDIYALSFDDDGNPDDLDVFAHGVGLGHHAGLGVDACGNVYVADFEYEEPIFTRIFRISASGEVDDEPLVDSTPGYLAGLEWGSGIGGWNETSLFISDGYEYTVFRIDIGVPSKPMVYP